jgi:transcriptional regulator with XRE-family HTH domain
LMQGSLATKLRVMRAERGLTLRQAAPLLGVRPGTLSELERGARHPHDLTLAKIAKGYGVPVEELLEEPVLAGKAEAPEAGQPAVTQVLAELVDGLAEAGNEEVLDRVWRVLEAERNRLAEMHLVDDPQNPVVRGEFARAVERLAYVGLRLEALRQAPAEQGAEALVEEA